MRWLRGVGKAQGAGVIVAWLLLGTISGAMAEEPAVYELDEVLEKAREHAALQAEMEAGEDLARATRSRADRARWPRLEAQSLLAPVPANADPSRIDANIDEILGLSIGPFFQQTVRIVVPIYTFGRISTVQELGELGVDVASLKRRRAVDDHLLETRRAYYGRQLSTSFAEILAEGAQLVTETLEQMEADRAFGEAEFGTADLRRLQIFDAEIEVMALDNERLYDLTGAALRHLTDQDTDLRVPPLDAAVADVDLHDLSTYQAAARSHRHELRLIQQAVQARRIEEDLARRQIYPNIFVAGDFRFGWSTEDPALQPVCRRLEPEGLCIDDDTLFARPWANPFDTLNLGVSLGMRWDFQPGDFRGRYRQAQARHSQMEARRQQVVAGVELEIEQTWRRAYDARRRIDIEERRLEAARRWRHQEGLSADLSGEDDIKELIDPIRHFYEAKIAYLEATHAYLVARAELGRAVGVQSLSDVDTESR